MRELKSVHFDAVTMLLKLVLFAPHENKENIFKQIGLISVSVVGEQLGGPGVGLVQPHRLGL